MALGGGTLRHFVPFLAIAWSYNRVYLILATSSPKFLASLETSDILKSLYEMVVFTILI